MLAKFAATVALAASLASAQTHTDCNPLEKKCPNDNAVGSKPINIDFTKGANSFFKELDGTDIDYDPALGAIFTIEKDGQAPTIASNRTIFFGEVEVKLRAAPGAGIVTSLVLQSLDLDEIDWEWIGNDIAQVQTNYFSKGCDEVYGRGTYEPVSNSQAEFHTYTIKWTPSQLDWIVNGQVVRTLKNEGLSGCNGYPQTPMQIKIGTWVGGRKDAPEGTVTWAGGLADFKKGPFVSYYQSVKIVDYMGGDGTPGSGASEASQYEWTDNSGSADSIKVIGGDGKGNSGTKTSTTTSSTKTSTKTSTPTPSSSDVSSSAAPSSSGATPSGSGSPGPSQSGGSPPAESSDVIPSGGEKLALPFGMGLAALFAALL